MNGERLVFEGEFRREFLEEARYVYIPFKVPPNTRTIEVEYSYSPSSDCKIDIGIFKPGTLELIKGMANFRGWSGTSKKSFYLSETHATPGYIPGRVEPGTWHIVLGLYKIPREGCRYRLVVRLGKADKQGSACGSPVRREAFVKKGWVRGDFHLHSVHSDGDASIDEIAERALDKGLDFVAVSDHNTFSQVIEAGLRGFWIKGVLFVPSVEVTTYRGHMNVFGIGEPVEFRITSEKDMRSVIDYIKSRGYLPSVSHPKPLGPDWEWGGLEEVGTLEVWQGVWEFNNYIALSQLDKVLAKGEKVSIVGGSDAHQIKNEIPGHIFTLGRPTTWVYVRELDVRSVIEAVRRRHVFISESPNGPRIEVEAETRQGRYMMGDVLRVSEAKIAVTVYGAEKHLFRAVSARGVEFHENIDKPIYRKTMTVSSDVGYIRFETLREAPEPLEPHSEDNILSSISSPVFFK